MDIVYLNKDRLLKVNLKEEIDHHTSEKIRRRVDYEIQRYLPRKVIFDFGSVTFMDSAGIGVIIGRYKLISTLGGKMQIINLKPQVEKILKMSGILKIIDIYKDDKKEKIV